MLLRLTVPIAAEKRGNDRRNNDTAAVYGFAPITAIKIANLGEFGYHDHRGGKSLLTSFVQEYKLTSMPKSEIIEIWTNQLELLKVCGVISTTN